MLGFLCYQQEKHRAKVKEKLDKCVKEKLMDFCDVLNIPVSKASTKKVIIFFQKMLYCMNYM